MFARARDDMLAIDPGRSPFARAGRRRSVWRSRPIQREAPTMMARTAQAALPVDGAATSGQLSVQRLIADLAAAIRHRRGRRDRRHGRGQPAPDRARRCSSIGPSCGRRRGRGERRRFALLDQASAVVGSRAVADWPQFPSSRRSWKRARPRGSRRIDDVPDPVDREAFLRHGLRSAAVVPVALTGAPRTTRCPGVQLDDASTNGRPRSSNSCAWSRTSSARLWRARPA